MADLNLAKLERESVQQLPQVDTKSGASDASFWSWFEQRGSILPAWGTRERERWLRAYDRNEYNTLWQGATSGLIKKIKTTPYELKGGRNLTHRFDSVLREAHFGAGWSVFLSLVLRDYLRFDGGAYVEVIAPGNPLKPPTGAATGIAHLDAYRCIPTGDPEYPVVYLDRNGGIHVMHHTRILHLIDMPDGDQDHPGYGLCALSRAIAVVNRQLLINQYIASNLDDKPSPGVVVANNINQAERDMIFAAFRREQSTDTPPEWGRVAWVFNMNSALKASLENFTFSRPPEKFDYPVYVNLDINELALAIGVDKQELWELSGATGTAGQSIIQAEKSEGKAPGEIRATLEREINSKLLPESLEFQWKVRDGRAAQQEAATASVWTGVASQLVPLIGKQLAAEILANQVEAVADALFDANGDMVRLDDQDERPPDAQPQQLTIDDSAPAAPATNGEPVTTQDNAPLQLVAKAFADTAQSFVSSFVDLVNGALDDDVSRRRAGTVLRGQIARYGRAAYADGLEAGGVDDGLSDEDLARAAVLVSEQSQYVTSFLDTVYGKGLSEAQVEQHATLWVNKSLTDFYNAGQLSANANGLYEWQLGATEKHCATCLRMNGQKHRLKEYHAKGILPKSGDLDCGGWQCDCSLTRTTGRARGSW